MEAPNEVGMSLRLNGVEKNLRDAARNLRAIDRAWAFAVSVEAYQEGFRETWARQTQYAPRPTGLRISKQSPTIIELWEAVDVPAIVAGGFSVFAYVVTNVEKIATIPGRIAIARISSRIEQRELEERLRELELGDDILLVEPPEPPPIAVPGEEQEPIALVELRRDEQIELVLRELDRLSRLDVLRDQLDADLSAIEDRGTHVQRELERVEPEILGSYGITKWRARRRRSL